MTIYITNYHEGSLMDENICDELVSGVKATELYWFDIIMILIEYVSHEPSRQAMYALW